MRNKSNGFKLNLKSWFFDRTEDDPDDEDEVRRHRNIIATYRLIVIS